MQPCHEIRRGRERRTANGHRIISREISEYVYEVCSNGETILYSPILHMARAVDPSAGDEHRNVLASQFVAWTLSRMVESKPCILQPAGSPWNMDRMTILPNFKCNFNCSYCYASGDRSGIELDSGVLDVALDWFLDAHRVPESDLYIHIVGGGEPVLSWELVEKTIKKASDAERARGRKVHVAMTTNGALVTDGMARFLAASDVFVNVSFEVLRDVQNRQRGPYDAVERGMAALQRAGCNLAIRATITPLNVDRMPEMVDIVLRKFPEVWRLNLEAVWAGRDVFPSAESLRRFLLKFRIGFDEASRVGSHSHLKVSSAAMPDFGMMKNRFCSGDFCLTPHGDIVICHRIASPNEDLYKRLVFGRIEGGRLMIDEEGYQRALAFSLDDGTRCRHCFLRWHCGGLCLAKQRSFPDEYYNVLCDSLREAGFARLEGIAGNVFRDLGRAGPFKTTIQPGTGG